MALFVALVGGYVVTSYIRSSLLELKISDSSFHEDNALNLAEAGAETGVLAVNQRNWSGWTLSGNDATKALSPVDIGNGAVGNVTVEVRDKDFTPTIISEATILLDSGASIREQIEVELRPRSQFANAITARNWTYFFRGSSGGNVIRIDSYDSIDGSYHPILNRSDHGDVACAHIYTHSQSRAEIFGHAACQFGGAFSLGNNGKVFGNTTPNGIDIDPERTADDFKSTFPDETDPGGGSILVMPTTPVPTVVNIGNGATTERYRIPVDLRIDAPHTLRINGKVILIIEDDLYVYGLLDITPLGELEVYVKDDIRTNAFTRIVNQTQEPARLRFYSMANADWQSSMWFQGIPDLYAVIYAPRSYVDISGNGSSGSMFGAVIGHRVVVRGNFNLHYDKQLANFTGNQRTFTIEQWRHLEPNELVALSP